MQILIRTEKTSWLFYWPSDGVVFQMRLRFQWGQGAGATTGYLCSSTYDGVNTFRLKMDSNQPWALLFNEPRASIPMHTTVTFNVDSSGKPQLRTPSLFIAYKDDT